MGLVDDKITPGEFLKVTLFTADYLEAGNHHVEFSLKEARRFSGN
jgi:hypothetical protein